MKQVYSRYPCSSPDRKGFLKHAKDLFICSTGEIMTRCSS